MFAGTGRAETDRVPRLCGNGRQRVLADAHLHAPALFRRLAGGHRALVGCAAEWTKAGLLVCECGHRDTERSGREGYNTRLVAGSKHMDNDEDDVFLREMADVVPLKREPRVARAARERENADFALQHRRQAAVEQPGRDRNILSEEDIPPLDAWYVLEFKRPGVQNGVFRKLKQGRYEMEARLDLHRMTAARARRELFEFVEESHALGLRCVQLIHGKGEGRGEREASAVLKGCADHWLRQLEVVQAFHSAQPRHGGTGAVYVLLKKSEAKKRENRERFRKGRVPYDRGD